MKSLENAFARSIRTFSVRPTLFSVFSCDLYGIKLRCLSMQQVTCCFDVSMQRNVPNGIEIIITILRWHNSILQSFIWFSFILISVGYYIKFGVLKYNLLYSNHGWEIKYQKFNCKYCHASPVCLLPAICEINLILKNSWFLLNVSLQMLIKDSFIYLYVLLPIFSFKILCNLIFFCTQKHRRNSHRAFQLISEIPGRNFTKSFNFLFPIRNTQVQGINCKWNPTNAYFTQDAMK